jgi:hypothetical protein
MHRQRLKHAVGGIGRSPVLEFLTPLAARRENKPPSPYDRPRIRSVFLAFGTWHTFENFEHCSANYPFWHGDRPSHNVSSLRGHMRVRAKWTRRMAPDADRQRQIASCMASNREAFRDWGTSEDDCCAIEWNACISFETRTDTNRRPVLFILLGREQEVFLSGSIHVGYEGRPTESISSPIPPCRSTRHAACSRTWIGRASWVAAAGGYNPRQA